MMVERRPDQGDRMKDPIERIAHHLYAGGPYGEFFCFADMGARAITDAHSMDVYRRIVRDVLDAANPAYDERAIRSTVPPAVGYRVNVEGRWLTLHPRDVVVVRRAAQ